ncbi:MAG: trypsin-like peptidase domain-containing protein, partial [Ruaniaceae bacterium]|nr:trypsin-like peptidase domain-containing protein [Ruaniaceae bacterium]
YPAPAPQYRASTPPRGATRSRVWPAVVTASLASAALATAGTFAVMNSTPSVESAAAETPTAQQVSQLVTTELESVVSDVADTVVAIDVRSQSGESLGSGVIIDASGYILTNNHVVSGATALQVTLADGRIYSASIVGTDATTDLAVVKLDNAPSDLTVATIGDSSALQVGQDVVAVGNPLGLSSTVTTGIVSALDRPVSTVDQAAGDRVVTNAIQVDAAINPGNSGGPLFNASGEVIGITSSIAALASDSGSIGLGFAIPSNLAQRVATEIIETGTASHALLGVSLGDTAVQVDGVTRAGAQVAQVVAGSGAANAGLRAGDVIVSIDGNTVTGAESLTGFVREYTPGSQAVLGVVRDGTLEEITATLGTSS